MSATEMAPDTALERVVRWYFERVYGQWDGPATRPFYCDPERTGHFAVDPTALTTGCPVAIFQLFVALSMYQGVRDVQIMRQQRTMSRSLARALTDVDFVRASRDEHVCWTLRSMETFDASCDIGKVGRGVDCGHYPGTPCHVKTATVAFNRMGDMGKLPTSAWFRLWKDDGLQKLLDDVVKECKSPTERAVLLVERFAGVHRVGRKLATMFVSALSTPALAPGLSPWFPVIDGNDLVVVDTNVTRAVDALRPPDAVRTYGARERWIRDEAKQIDLRQFHADVPGYSPRLVQQALYAFCSKSNRIARGDQCALAHTACGGCVSIVCPFFPGNCQQLPAT